MKSRFTHGQEECTSQTIAGLGDAMATAAALQQRFIKHLYLKRFGREQPEVVVPIEKRARISPTPRASRD